MQQIKCIVFDWDGTLMDSAPRIVSAMQTAALNVGLPTPTEDAVRHIIGLSLPKVFDVLFPERTTEQEVQLMEAYRFQYVEADPTPTPLFDGVLGILDYLRNGGFQLTVATGKARQGLNRVLNEVGLVNYFDFSIAADEAESKPHPQMLYRTAEKLGLARQEMLMVGDTSYDMEMAFNAEVDSVAVTYGAHSKDKLEPFRPKHYINSIHQLADLL